MLIYVYTYYLKSIQRFSDFQFCVYIKLGREI